MDYLLYRYDTLLPFPYNNSKDSFNIMSKHSKNNTSSSVFTYQQRQKLKSVYGTHQSRIGQDSIKTFEMCTICNNRLIEPTCCDQGHMFCRSCVIQFMVKQKKRIAEQNSEIDRAEKRVENQKKQKELESQVQKLQTFEKYDGFVQITNRKELMEGSTQRQEIVPVVVKEIKPIGIYELNPRKDDYVKTAFWTLNNAPDNVDKVEKQSNVVTCPGSNHKLILKKLRTVILKELERQFCCWICNKQVKRQRVGAYKCGHLVCDSCKSNKCEICEQSSGWIPIENSLSSFAAHHKAQVKTYSHAFVA